MDSPTDIKKQVDLKKVPPPVAKKSHLLFNITLLIISLSFGVLAFFAKNYAYFPVDLAITLSIQSISIPGFRELLIGVTTLGNMNVAPFVIVAITVLLLFLKKAKEAGLIFISSVGIFIIGEALKSAIQRPRPDPSLIHQLATFTRNDSFPSGHVLFAIGLFGSLLYLLLVHFKKTWFSKLLIGLCGVLIVLMGISRIYVGAHWFSDTLGSYLVGFIWLSLMAFIYHKVNRG